MKLIYSSYSPNTRPKDLNLNYRLLLSPRRWLDTGSISRVNDHFLKLHPGKTVLTYSHARSALFELLSSISKPNGNVVYQGFTCAAASLPAVWAGLTPRYVDIQKGKLVPAEDTIIAGIDPQTVAVVVQVTLGSVPSYEKVREICKQRGILLILDSTHFIPTSNSEVLPETDVIIYSLGRDKVVSGVDGGVMVFDPELDVASTLNTRYLSLHYPGSSWVFKRILFPILWRTIKSTYVSGFGKVLHLIYTKSGLISRATTKEEKQGERPKHIPTKLPGALAEIAMGQLEDISEIQSYRALLFQKFIKALGEDRNITIVEENPDVVPLRMALRVKDRTGLMKYMKEQNILLGDWYWNPVAPATFSPYITMYVEGSCPNAEDLCRDIINLPLHANISPSDADRIILELTNYYNSHV